MARQAVPPGQEFVFRTDPATDVGRARTVNEFTELVEGVDDDAIEYHLRNDINDFAVWAAYSLDNKALAKRMGNAKRARTPTTKRKRILTALKGPTKRT
ncbi:MAG: DUF5752 family protein [Methanopyri archaeon]|nr:DUF5752 family protein [Methanopyri archaeon]|tara:strand:+ start:23 stop:319 length:297 start_codon:yes stop_codon:yes gene_type:complete